ncbi:MAG: hypothetical protein H0U55_04655 [Rubrobacteraceae bacterium]|nr:hypothetical protein [Rubrobacteraceae bacterium]
MDHKRRVPEDLMGTILGAGSGVPDEEQVPGVDDEGGATVSWEENPERVGVAFNLSKQVSTELDRLRLELEDDTHSSKSEIAEVALRIAVEDARSRGRASELIKRLEEIHAARAVDATDDSPRVERSVDQSGSIIETTYGEGGEILDEDVVGSVADLPVDVEYVDEQGRLVSLSKDELGNTFEQILDNNLRTLGTRLLDDS